MRRRLIAVLALSTAPGAHAQFSDSIPSSDVQWILSGDLTQGSGGPVFAVGDQIGVFFGETLIGVTELDPADVAAGRYSELFVAGDDPETAVVEGPGQGAIIRFRYFDDSTNTVLTSVQALNSSGEAFNVAYAGGPFIPTPFPLPIPIGESATINLRVGAAGDDGGGGGGGGGETPTTGDPDVDGDGRVTRKDAALVLRVVIGGTRTLPSATVSRADVNGDGTVSTNDAIAVFRAM